MTNRKPPRRLWQGSLLVALITTCLCVAASVAWARAAHLDVWPSSYRYCGTLKPRSADPVDVYAKDMQCRLSLRIEWATFFGPRNQLKVVNGGSGANGYILPKRFPGFRCGSGAGAGQCVKGKQWSTYVD
jgi:hypothetical protein